MVLRDETTGKIIAIAFIGIIIIDLLLFIRAATQFSFDDYLAKFDWLFIIYIVLLSTIIGLVLSMLIPRKNK